MKKLFIVMFILTIILLAGCNSRNFNRGRSMNITDGQRQAMFEEIQQEMMDECEGKNEGDICQIDNPRGDVNGSCEIRDDILICFSNRTIGPRRE